MVKVARFAGARLTGIKALQGKHKRASVAVCGSGVTLNDLDLSRIPDHWIVVAVNEAIRKLGSRADYWVLSDEPIVRGYAKLCPRDVTILAMHQATISIPAVCPHHEFYTVNSINKIVTPDDGFNFFSRGTVLIGAIEMLRYTGAKRFYCFGLDCYRTEEAYYYDGRKPPMVTEQRCDDRERGQGVPPGVRIYVTSRLQNMVKKLNELRREGLWNEVEIFCVNSPYSQQTAIPKISPEEFKQQRQRSIDNFKRKRRRKHAEAQAAIQEGSPAAGTEEPEVFDDSGSGGAAYGDGQDDALVVTGAGGEAIGSTSEPGGGHPTDGGLEETGLRGDRDSHGGDSDTDDEGSPGSSGDGDLPDD